MRRLMLAIPVLAMVALAGAPTSAAALTAPPIGLPTPSPSIPAPSGPPPAVTGSGLGAVPVPPLPSITPSPSASPAYTVQRDVRIRMSDGVLLDSDQYIPSSGCPCPVILVQTPYRKEGTAVAEANPVFPQHGYAEIAVDVRGTGSSEGVWQSFGQREQQDGAELVRYAAAQPFSNGRVGLAGVSYSAINQLLTVEQPNTSAVKAIFPIVPMGDAYRDVTWAGGNIDSGFIPLWLGLVTSLGLIPASDAGQRPVVALNAESQHAYGIAYFQGQVVADSALGADESKLPPALQTWKDEAYDTSFATSRSPLYRIGSVKVPAFIVGGEWDIFQRGEPLLYQGLNLPSSQKKLLLGPWYHETEGTGLPATDSSGRTIPDLDTLQLAWFDRWLKGIPDGVESFPDETWFQGADRWVPGAYPAGKSPATWYLGAAPSGSAATSLYDGSLGTGRPAAGSAALPWTAFNGACSRSTTQWTAGTVQAGPCDTDQRPTEAQGVTFTGPAATAPYPLSGPLDLHLDLRSLRPDATVIAAVSDVGPDGSSNPITAGSLVLSMRRLTSTACGAVVVNCTEYAGGKPIIPWHPYTLASQSALEQGRTYQVDLEIFPTSAVIEPGHRLRLTLTTSDVPHEAGTASTDTASAAGAVTILFGPQDPSYLYLETFSGSGLG